MFDCRDNAKGRHEPHGFTAKGKDRRVYWRWAAMIGRCTNRNHPRYKDYGGRGIKVCHRWRSFASFVADMGVPPEPRMTLERIDNNGDYSPENCVWASYQKQNWNRWNNSFITANGESLPVKEWARLLNVNHNAINYRLRRGWSHERAINQPFVSPRRSV